MALALNEDTPAARRVIPARSRATSARTHEARALALRRVVAEVSANLELSEVFEDVLDSSQALFGADVAALWLMDPGRHPLRLAAHRDLDPELIEGVGALRPSDDAAEMRAIAERRALVVARPETAPRFADVYAPPGLPHDQLRPARVPRRIGRAPRALPPDPVRLDARRARAVHVVRERHGDGRRECPPVQLGPGRRGATACDPGALVTAQPNPGRGGDRRGDRCGGGSPDQP